MYVVYNYKTKLMCKTSSVVIQFIVTLGNSHESLFAVLNCGVPQGSVLGLLLFVSTFFCLAQ